MCEKYVKHSWCGSHVTNHLMCKNADNEFSTYFRETNNLLGHHLLYFSRISFPCYSISLRQRGEDKLLWAPSKEGKFNVCSFYNVFISHVSNPFLWKSIWQTKVPSRVAFFAWTVSLGKDLTIDNMRKKDTLLLFIGATCVREVGESMDQFLLHCKMASAWWSIFSVSLAWIMSWRIMYLFGSWGGLGGSPLWSVVENVSHLHHIWCIWRKMNDSNFGGCT